MMILIIAVSIGIMTHTTGTTATLMTTVTAMEGMENTQEWAQEEELRHTGAEIGMTMTHTGGTIITGVDALALAMETGSEEPAVTTVIPTMTQIITTLTGTINTIEATIRHLGGG